MMAKICLIKILQIETSPDDPIGNILQYKASVIIEVWCNFKYYFFRYPKANFALQFFHI